MTKKYNFTSRINSARLFTINVADFNQIVAKEASVNVNINNVNILAFASYSGSYVMLDLYDPYNLDDLDAFTLNEMDNGAV